VRSYAAMLYRQIQDSRLLKKGETTMPDSTYPPPVAALLAFGNPRGLLPDPPLMTDEEIAAVEELLRTDMLKKHDPYPRQSLKWPDYRAGGIGPEHIPDLLRMVRDEDLWESDNEDDPASFAPIHAWRTLGQLGAEEAISPLIALLDPYDDWDWFQKEVPEVLGLIGPTAIAPLAVILANTMRPVGMRTTAGSALGKIGRMHPDARTAAVTPITDAITASLTSDAPLDDLRELNGFLISELIDLEETDALPLIARVFAADRVDESIPGDLEDVEIAFGVRERRDTPRPHYNIFSRLPVSDPIPPSSGAVKPVTAKKDKRKRQIARQSRRVNRKKK